MDIADPPTIPQVKESLASIERATILGQRDYALIKPLGQGRATMGIPTHSGRAFRRKSATDSDGKADIEDIRQQGGEAGRPSGIPVTVLERSHVQEHHGRSVPR